MNAVCGVSSKGTIFMLGLICCCLAGFVHCVYCVQRVCVLSLTAGWTRTPGIVAPSQLADQERGITLCLEVW